MIKLNYELIYKIRQTKLPTNSRYNLINQYSNKAINEADIQHSKYLEFLKKELGTEEFEVTSEYCLAEGIIGHVYVGDQSNKGNGNRKCCFCGCDDFDGI